MIQPPVVATQTVLSHLPIPNSRSQRPRLSALRSHSAEATPPHVDANSASESYDPYSPPWQQDARDNGTRFTYQVWEETVGFKPRRHTLEKYLADVRSKAHDLTSAVLVDSAPIWNQRRKSQRTHASTS